LKDVPFAGLFGATQNAEIRDLTVALDTAITTTGAITAGGVAGYADANTVFRNVRATGSLSVASSGSGYLYIGGFAGAENGTDFFNCSTNVQVTISDSRTGNGALNVGGFLGRMFFGSTLSTCYAQGNVTVNGSGSSGLLKVGGLTGYSAGNNNNLSTISKCYASGDLTVNSAGISDDVEAGGLTSNAEYLTINDCYALGNVTLNRTSGGNITTRAGGLVGSLSANGIVKNSFASGEVDATQNTGSIYAGGLVGKFLSGSISYCAALNTSVSASAPNTDAGRVTGDGSGGWSNNYAYSGMTVLGSTVSPGSLADKQGAAAADDALTNSGLRNWYFWNYILQFHPGIWNFNRVLPSNQAVPGNSVYKESGGYPVLVDLQ
jgi:hypothetical protein